MGPSRTYPVQMHHYCNPKFLDLIPSTIANFQIKQKESSVKLRTSDVTNIIHITSLTHLQLRQNQTKKTNKQMILRIRLPSGATERVTLSPTDDLQQLGEKINALNKLEGQFRLYSNPRFTEPFVFENAKHGDFVYIEGTVIPTPSPSQSTTITTTTNPQSSTNNKNKTTTTNPSSSNGESSSSKQKGPGSRCRCGPRGMCEKCMPKEDKRERAEAELKRHGSRSSSIAVLEALEALKVRISPQESPHAAAAAIDSDAANAFQAHLAEIAFSQQRIAYCFGNVVETAKDDDNDSNGMDDKKKSGQSSYGKTDWKSNDEDENGNKKKTTSVHVLYEPPQCGNADIYTLVDEDNAGDITQRAHALSSMLGMSHVGLVISTKPRRCILSAFDIVFAAEMLSKMTEAERKSFIIFVVTTTETGQTEFEAYQLSDLAVDMFEQDVFEDLSKQKANGGRVLCKQDVLVEGKDARKVPTEFFILNIPIKSCNSWLNTKFTIENRDLTPQNPASMQNIIRQDSIPYHKRLADFHLLLFLSNHFDMKTDMPGLCAAVKQGDDIDEGYRLMIDNMAASA